MSRCTPIEVMRGPQGPTGQQGPQGASGGITLMASLIGASLNPTQRISFQNLSGGVFSAGDTITDSITGSAAYVESVHTGYLTVSRMSGTFSDTDSFDNGSGVSADVVNDTFIPDQVIPLNLDGYVFDVLITNSSGAVMTATNLQINSGANRSGWAICTTGGAADGLFTLSSPQSFISITTKSFSPTSSNIRYTLYSNDLLSRTKVTNQLYMSVIGEGTDITCDIYVYGYVL